MHAPLILAMFFSLMKMLYVYFSDMDNDFKTNLVVILLICVMFFLIFAR
jgi:hypothetical protein